MKHWTSGNARRTPDPAMTTVLQIRLQIRTPSGRNVAMMLIELSSPLRNRARNFPRHCPQNSSSSVLLSSFIGCIFMRRAEKHVDTQNEASRNTENLEKNPQGSGVRVLFAGSPTRPAYQQRQCSEERVCQLCGDGRSSRGVRKGSG